MPGRNTMTTQAVYTGEFAEAVRDQFLNERIEYYKDLENAIANAAAADGEDLCTREHVKSGLLMLDPDMASHAVCCTSCFL